MLPENEVSNFMMAESLNGVCIQPSFLARE